MAKMSKRAGLLFAAAAMGLILAGCGAEKEPEVIGEKSGISQEAPTGSEESESSGIDAALEEGGVREQVQAPERYQVKEKEEKLIISADAPVIVPDVQQMEIQKYESVNFTDEEYRKVKDTLSKELKVSWKPDNLESDESDNPNKDMIAQISEMGSSETGVDYHISYQTSINEGEPPHSSKIWLTRRNTEGRSISRSAIIYEAGEEEAVQRASKAEELEKRTEELLKAVGFEHYGKYQGMWEKSFYSFKKEETSEMEYRLTYTPVISGVGSTRNGVNMFGNFYLYGPYIDVFYDEDGTLNQLKIIDKEVRTDAADTSSFLLPFESVGELFQQYCKDYFRQDQSWEKEDSAKKPILNIDSLPVVTVKNVKLEYVFLQPETLQKGNEMELVPAWNFYGNIKNGFISKEDGDVETEDYWTARQEPEGLLLSIRADDGQILVD